MLKKKRSSGLAFYLVFILMIFLATHFLAGREDIKRTTLYELETLIEEGKVKSAVIDGTTIKVELVPKAVDRSKGLTAQITKDIPHIAVPQYLEMLQKAAREKKITDFDYKKPADIGNLVNVAMLVMLIVSVGVFVYISWARQGSDGRSAMSFGRNRARLSDPSKNRVTFADVAGADEEKNELQEVVDFLKRPKKYTDLGARIPKGILLVGPPGTGKTLLAKAVAGEAKVPFFSISGSDFVEMFVGVGASRVRTLFADAKKQTPCIIFIDEIDAVGRQRGAGLGGGHDEREQTLNQLLVEMDGFGPNEGVIVIAATNRPDILDPALLRPGRFDRRIMVTKPDILGREAVLKVHAKGKPLANDVNLAEIARMTSGFTGADLANLLNESALLAARHKQTVITFENINEAVFKITMGPEKKSRIISEKERYSTAIHEAGHAIILRETSDTDRVQRVSIIPVGAAGGYTAWRPNEDTYFRTKNQLLAQIATGLGGRAAEKIVFNELSTGASEDLKSCNKIARNMITTFGMSERLGNVVLSDDDEVFLGRDYGHASAVSESLQSAIDEEISRILEECFEKATSILRDNRQLLDEVAASLMQKEKITAEEFEALYAKYVVNFKPAPGDEQEESEKAHQQRLDQSSDQADSDSTGETEGSLGGDIVKSGEMLKEDGTLSSESLKESNDVSTDASHEIVTPSDNAEGDNTENIGKQ